MLKVLNVFLTITLVMILYFLSNAIVPFFLGITISYIALPLCNIIHRKFKIRLSSACFISIIMIYIVIIATIVLIIPFFYDRIFFIINSLTSLDIQKTLKLFESFELNKVFDIVKEEILGKIPVYINSILNSTQSFLSFSFSIIFAPMISIYFLQDIYFSEIKKHFLIEYLSNLSEKFIQTQLLMILFYSFYYFLLLFFIELKDSITLAFLCGLAYIIPYIGSIIGLSICMLMTIVQYHFDYHSIILLIGFLFISVLDMIIISPKFIGPKFGLHPLLTIFSLLISSHMFGIIGAILAMPFGVIIKNIFENILKYLESKKLHI